MTIENAIDCAGISLSALFGIAASSVFAEISPPDIPNWANAGIAAFAFGAMWVLHRDSLNRFETRVQSMHVEALADRKSMSDTFTAEIHLQRGEFLSALNKEMDGWRSVLREITLEIKTLREEERS